MRLKLSWGGMSPLARGRSAARRVRTAVVASVAVPAVIAGTLVAASSVPAAADTSPFPPVDKCVPAPGGIKCIRVRVWKAVRPANPKTAPTVIFLDGFRATWDKSGWEHNTNVAELAKQGINVVMPIGGDASFYTDWNHPSSFNHQPYTYKWESFLTQNMPPFLDKVGVSRNYSLVGISMGGTAAMTLAAHHPNLFKRAASLSGFLHMTAPGFPDAVAVAMLDQNAFNAVDMWGPLGGGRWPENDPYNLIPQLKGRPYWISAGTGTPGNHDKNINPLTLLQGGPLEYLSKASTEDFKRQADKEGLTKVTWDFPPDGLHSWGYWQHQVWLMKKANWFTST